MSSSMGKCKYFQAGWHFREGQESNAGFLAHAQSDNVEGDIDRLVAEVEQLQGALSASGKKREFS